MRYLILPDPRGPYTDADKKTFRITELSDTAKVSGPIKPIIAASEADAAKQAGLTLVPVPVKPVPAPRPEPVRTLSKLAIRRQPRDWGKESAFEQMLDAFPHARTDWDDAVEIKTSDPLFATNKEAFKAALQLSEAQFTALMSLK